MNDSSKISGRTVGTIPCPNGETNVLLYSAQGEVVHSLTVKNLAEANSIMESWQNGTYQLLKS